MKIKVSAFRDKYLAAALISVFFLISSCAEAQIFQFPNPGLWGQGMHRFVPDSTLYFPTGCGAPSGIASLRSYGFTGFGQKIRQAAIYADTCGHHVYWFDWTDSTWLRIDTGGGGSTIDTTSLSNRINLKIDSIRRRSDSVFWYADGMETFAFIDARFGVAGEDASATQARHFNINGHDFSIDFDGTGNNGLLFDHTANVASLFYNMVGTGASSVEASAGGMTTAWYDFGASSYGDAVAQWHNGRIQLSAYKGVVLTDDFTYNPATSSPAASSILDIRSIGSNKGILIPRLTTTQMNAISSPATGLLIYNMTAAAFYYYNGSAWTAIGGGGGSPNTSVGGKYAVAVNGTNNVKSLDTAFGTKIDSSQANIVKIGVDSGSVLPVHRLADSTAALRTTIAAKLNISDTSVFRRKSDSTAIPTNYVTHYQDDTAKANLRAAGGSLPSISNYSYRGKLGGSDTVLKYSVYNVIDFGIKNDSSADMSTFLQLLINLVPQGSTIYFPAGKYRLDSKVTISKTGLKIQGSSGPILSSVTGTHSAAWNPGTTTIYFSSASDTAFYVSAGAVQFEQICLSQAGGVTPTSSVGIAYNNGHNSRLYNAGFMGFNVNVDMEAGFQWAWNNCFFYAPKTYNAIIRDTAIGDAGDQFVSGCYFYSAVYNSSAHVRYESGGGLKMVGNKFNFGSDNKLAKYGIDAALNKTSVDILITGNSIENFDSSAIYIHPSVTFGDITITGNQISSYRNNTDRPNIWVDGTGTTLSNVSITGNVMRGFTTDTAIYIKNVSGVTVSGISYTGFGANNQRLVFGGVNTYAGIQRFDYTHTLTGASPTLDPSLGRFANYTLTGVDTINFTAGVPNERFQLMITQDATGGRTLYCPGCINAAQGTSLIGLDPSANGVTMVDGYFNSASTAVITRVSRKYNSGSVPYWDAVNGLSEDNANLRYYAAGPSLLVGPKTLNIAFGQIDVTTDASNFTPNIQAGRHIGSSLGSSILLSKTRGTANSPTASQVSDYHGQLWFAGHDGSTLRYPGIIGAYVDSAVSSNSVPTSLFFKSGLTTDVDAKGAGDIGMNLDHRGRLGLGLQQITDTALFTIGGNFGTFNNGAYGNIMSVRQNTVVNWGTSVTTATYSGIGIRQPIFSALNAQTYTNGATLWLEGSPVASTNVTIPNPWTLYVNSGKTYFGGMAVLSDSVKATKLPNKATPAATDSLLLKDANGNIYSTPATAISVTGKNDIYFDNSDTSFKTGSALMQDTYTPGGGFSRYFGTNASNLDSFAVYAGAIHFSTMPVVNGNLMMASVRGQDEVSQTTFKGAFFTPSADGVFEAGGYIKINSISTNTMHIEVQFTDPGSTVRTLVLYPTGTNSDATTTGYYLFPTVMFRAKAGAMVQVSTFGTSGGSMNYDWGMNVKQLR